MADTARIDELRRRLQKDPASIAFAQLAEEYRRAGRFMDAVECCRAGLKRHPGYLSARVTLGRALLEVGELEAARSELDDVLRAAPQNLAAIRGLAEIHRRKGELREALDQYRSAFELAQNDPGIDQIVRDLRRELGPADALPRPVGTPPVVPFRDGMSAPLLSPARTQAEQAASDVKRTRLTAMVGRLEQWLSAILDDRRNRLFTRPA